MSEAINSRRAASNTAWLKLSGVGISAASATRKIAQHTIFHYESEDKATKKVKWTLFHYFCYASNTWYMDYLTLIRIPAIGIT